jgi:RNA polymerase sigma factor (sigma-70 family)
MENLAAAEPEARARLTDEEAQELVLRTVSTHAESLLRTAYRHSICADDAHDAYQRAMEILLRRARRLDPESVHKWIHVVVKHEALDVRRSRAAAVAYEDIDFDRHVSPDVSSPEDRAVVVDRTTRAAEALRRLKPHELRAMWLKAMGHSYAEISDITGYSPTKVNRCLTEGRKSFLERYEGIETGAECERWQPVLSAMVDGEATAAQLTEARPHLRNCPACRATLRSLHDANRPLSAVLPVGLVSAGAKLSGLLDRVLGGAAASADPAAAAGGAGVLGIGGAKLAGVLAAGAVATAGAGGGLAAVEHETHHAKRKAAVHRSAPAASTPTVASVPALVPSGAARPAAAAATVAKKPAPSRKTSVGSKKTPRLAARRAAETRRIEFAPAGEESAPQAVAATPTPTSSPTPTPSPSPAPKAPSTDSSTGEFAPQP